MWKSSGQTFCTAAKKESVLEKTDAGQNQETVGTNFQELEDAILQLQKDVNFKDDMVIYYLSDYVFNYIRNEKNTLVTDKTEAGIAQLY